MLLVSQLANRLPNSCRRLTVRTLNSHHSYFPWAIRMQYLRWYSVPSRSFLIILLSPRVRHKWFLTNLLYAFAFSIKLNNNNNNNNNTPHVECKNKGDTSNNMSYWDYLKVIQKIREQHTRKTWSQGTTKNSHIGHCTHTSGSANVKVHRLNTGPNDISTMNSNNSIAATLYSLGT